jgi:CheY-like chemotaxis protein
MRRMHGRERADQARLRLPNLKVLFTTGYTRNAVVQHYRLDPGVHLLGKPYSFDELARKVRSLLDRDS